MSRVATIMLYLVAGLVAGSVTVIVIQRGIAVINANPAGSFLWLLFLSVWGAYMVWEEKK